MLIKSNGELLKVTCIPILIRCAYCTPGVQQYSMHGTVGLFVRVGQYGKQFIYFFVGFFLLSFSHPQGHMAGVHSFGGFYNNLENVKLFPVEPLVWQ